MGGYGQPRRGVADLRVVLDIVVTVEVVVGGEPNVGIVTLGLYPHGSDETASAIVSDLMKPAGYDLAAHSERAVDISGWRVAEGNGIERGQQSTWRSFARGTSSEVNLPERYTSDPFME